MSVHRTADLTVEQQARLTSGKDYWTTKPEGGAASIMMTDGPHGLRKQEGASDHLGLSGSVAATCFPPAVGLAQTWNPEIAAKIGAAIADEALAAQVSVVLGPGINIKRSPLGGRNFEYFSEDPLLTAHLATAWVASLQGRGIGASLKHFAANNQETDRMRVSADIDERTLHEIYLRAFRHVVTQAQPWTVMCSYNRINGVHAFADRTLLTGILRDDWGFDGLVVSDWGAVDDRVAAVAAGCDLTMPFPGDPDDQALAAAAGDGTLDPEALRTSADRVLALVEKAGAASTDQTGFDVAAHHALAREAAGQAIVLLRNDVVDGSPVLPLDPSGDVLVIGELAKTPRYQGGGSSHVNATRVDAPLDAIEQRATGTVTFAPGYSTLPSSTDQEKRLLADTAVAGSRSAGTAVLVLGLADSQESEGFDRTDLALPADQVDLARRVLEANPRTVVVLCHGGVVDITAVDAPAVLDAALLGQAVGGAVADVLFGDVNPSGRLAETVPLRLQDTPAYLNFPGEHGHVTYGEGLFVGYRGYDARDVDVAYPFGHGLSYTAFEYSDLRLSSDDSGITVDLTVTNTGDRDGREVVQVYVGIEDSAVIRPVRELKGFANVAIAKGESVPVSIEIARDDLAYWDTRLHAFVVEPGTYTVAVGASSRDLRVTGTVEVTGEQIRVPLTMESSVAEILGDPGGAAVFGPMLGGVEQQLSGDSGDSQESMGVDLMTVMSSIPIERMISYSGGALTREALQQLLDQANAQAQPSA